MSIQDLWHSETLVSLVGTLVGVLWALFRSGEWFRRNQEQRYARALCALEAGVEQTYRVYVQALKEGRVDGKLTADEAAEARRRARESAIAFGRTQGVDVLRELGAECIDLLTAKLVKGLKHG